MPFRFRKSIKLFPGVKINISKSGISTSFGKRGASVNVGKKGVRTTVGIPGTGISHSSIIGGATSSQKTTPRSPHPQNQNLLDQSVGSPEPPDEIKSKSPKIKIPLGCVIASGIISMLCSVVFCISTITNDPTPKKNPTVDILSVQNTAAAEAWSVYTQTMIALTTTASQPTQTLIAFPTETIQPAQTLESTITPAPIVTNIITFTPYQTSTLIPAKIATLVVVPGSQNSGGCCKHCGANSKACGDSCISLNKYCHQPPGCACN